MTQDLGVDPFNHDVLTGGGYRYTTGAPLSCRLANARMTRASVDATRWQGRRAIDIGCGDGTYTVALLDEGGPATVHGVDPAAAAIEAAAARVDGDERLSFAVGSAYELDHPADAFDIAYLRGVLHHVERPVDAMREALRVAPLVVVVEPNGYNAGLKLLERVSRYHREHAERSYAPRALDRWSDSVGGRVVSRDFVGFVPMFSPEGYARVAKRIEPLLERIPLLRQATCAQYVFTIARR